MGVVYHAIDPNIGRPVAIKTIRLNEFATPEERERLRDRLFREARSAGILSHPGIVTIYDVEERDGVAYIAMEFVNGPTLESVLSSGEALPPDRIVQVLREAAAALDYAHRKGIVHRDIKPANIMLSEAGAVKITDFGIAKISKSEQLTQTGAILGTPNYMSPEQVQGVAVDGRSDQFSLSVIAYEMVTGERPFAGEQLTTTIYKIVHEEPPAVERLNPTLSARMDSVMRKGLSKKPEARYPNCTTLVSALEAASSNAKGWKGLPRGRSLEMPTLVRELPAVPTTADVVRPRPRRRVGRYVFAMLLGIALGGAGWYAYDQHLLDGLLGALERAQSTAQPAPMQQPSGQPQVPAPTPAQPPASGSAQDTQPSPGAPSDQTSNTQAQPPVPAPDQVSPPSAASPPKQTQPAKGAEPPPEQAAAPEPKHTAPAAKRRPALHEVLISSKPQGASVILDGRADTTCTTPCTVDASPGLHTLTVTLEGYQTIQRAITVTDEPFEMEPITLRSLGGTLMLSSEPSGAAIYVNGRKISDTTPAQLRLAPGSYNISVEKNGVRHGEQVNITGGISRLRIVLE